MLRRFPIFALVLVGLAGAAATVLLFIAGLPVTWHEWLDTGSGRVVYTRQVMGLQVSAEPANRALTNLYTSNVGPAGEQYWVKLRTFESVPEYMKFTNPGSQGSDLELSSEYLFASLGLFLVIDRGLLTDEEYADRMAVLDLRYTPECRGEVVLRAFEIVRQTGSVPPATDFATDVFALEQTTREALTPEHLPDVEQYVQRWRDGARR